MKHEISFVEPPSGDIFINSEELMGRDTRNYDVAHQYFRSDVTSKSQVTASPLHSVDCENNNILTSNILQIWWATSWFIPFRCCPQTECLGITITIFMKIFEENVHWAIAMTWRPSSSSSSVSKARFVTARAISIKLGVRIPLGNTPEFLFLFSRFYLFCGLQATILKILPFKSWRL
jgi:hypothetical protein